MCDINTLNEFKEKIVTLVKGSEYKDKVKPGMDPRIYLIDKNFYDQLSTSNDLEKLIRNFFEMGYFGMTVKYSEYEDYRVSSPKLKLYERDILIFKYKDTRDDQILSILTHELMHSLFPGIDITINTPECTSDERCGYNEACTDYLAEIFYNRITQAPGNYFTQYMQKLDEKGEKMEAYRKFKGNEEIQSQKLREYLG